MTRHKSNKFPVNYHHRIQLPPILLLLLHCCDSRGSSAADVHSTAAEKVEDSHSGTIRCCLIRKFLIRTEGFPVPKHSSATEEETVSVQHQSKQKNMNAFGLSGFHPVHDHLFIVLG